jgi:hypothetical protein
VSRCGSSIAPGSDRPGKTPLAVTRIRPSEGRAGSVRPPPVITGLSIAVALLVGTIEIAGILSDKLALHGGVWDVMTSFNLNEAGYIVVGLFIAVWLAAVAYWKLARVETRWSAAAIDKADQGAQRAPHPGFPSDRVERACCDNEKITT